MRSWFLLTLLLLLMAVPGAPSQSPFAVVSWLIPAVEPSEVSPGETVLLLVRLSPEAPSAGTLRLTAEIAAPDGSQQRIPIPPLDDNTFVGRWVAHSASGEHTLRVTAQRVVSSADAPSVISDPVIFVVSPGARLSPQLPPMPGENPPPDEQEILPSIENLVAVDMVPSVKSEVPETESETADSEPVQTSSKPWWAYLLVALGLLGLGVAGWAVKQHLRPRAKAQVAEEPAETSEEEMPEEKRREAAA